MNLLQCRKSIPCHRRRTANLLLQACEECTGPETHIECGAFQQAASKSWESSEISPRKILLIPAAFDTFKETMVMSIVTI
jgi:hypothetical protein